MYSPKQFEHSDFEFAHMVIAENPFAVICVANAGGGVDVVHVPTRFEPGHGDLGRLQFHVAKQNGIWNLFDGSREAVAIFSGPHAYISPDWYETNGLVPTWDYVAVHATGVPVVLPDANNATHVESLAAQEEAHLAPKSPWTTAQVDPNLYARMLKGIVGVEMPITHLQAKAKLSQNRSAEDKAGVAERLRERGGDLNNAIADLVILEQ